MFTDYWSVPSYIVSWQKRRVQVYCPPPVCYISQLILANKLRFSLELRQPRKFCLTRRGGCHWTRMICRVRNPYDVVLLYMLSLSHIIRIFYTVLLAQIVRKLLHLHLQLPCVKSQSNLLLLPIYFQSCLIAIPWWRKTCYYHKMLRRYFLPKIYA